MSEATIDDLASTFAVSAPGALAAEPGQNLLQVRGLRKNYGARRVVHDVSLDVRNGEVVDPVLVLVPEDATVPPVIPPVTPPVTPPITPPITPPGQVAPVPVDHPGLLALMGLVLALFGFTRIRKQRARG